MSKVICCPKCKYSSYERNGRYRCRHCDYYFPLQEAVIRDRQPARGPSKSVEPKPEKYKGKPAGRIIYPGFVYGASRLE